MNIILTDTRDQWLLKLFEKWVEEHIPMPEIFADPQQLWEAWLAGYRAGYDHAY